jgi:hypothetical protein
MNLHFHKNKEFFERSECHFWKKTLHHRCFLFSTFCDIRLDHILFITYFSSCILFYYSECLDSDSSPVPRPPKPTHQRSHSKPFSFPPSATVSAGSPPDGQQLRNSWSESSVEEAPPLPPRGLSESLFYILYPHVQIFESGPWKPLHKPCLYCLICNCYISYQIVD